MQPGKWRSLWTAVSAGANLPSRFLCGAEATVPLQELERGSTLGERAAELRGQSVLLTTTGQLPAALALLELDGVARRVVLCPPDFSLEHLPFVIGQADIDAIVSDRIAAGDGAAAGRPVLAPTKVTPAACDRNPAFQTEWVLFTSGTTGMPKMVVHTLSSLADAIDTVCTPNQVWSTFYDMRRYGGLQVFLRAMLGGGSLVLSSAEEPAADFLIRAAAHGISHISGTPSHWRRALMCPAVHRIAPQYVRLSGEIADQAILDHLRATFPEARVAHAFASTEAGVAFDVNDGLAGFPTGLIGNPQSPVRMKVQDGTLRIRSPRIASRYLGKGAEPVADDEGFVDTRDMVELRGDRYCFTGRRDGIINVGGLKVHPEEVEAVINRHPEVRMSLVRTRKNPITGALVVADVVLKCGDASANQPSSGVEQDIRQHCHQMLPRHKVPTLIRIVGALPVSPAGKLVRGYA